MIADFFDRYSRQARLLPALLTLFPAFLTVAVWVPALYQLAAGLTGLAIACGVLTVLAHFARSRGRKLEKQLIQEWGGLPTTIWLRKSDGYLEIETKQRYYNFLESSIPDWKAPTEDVEASDRLYSSAVRWLLERTRDVQQFPLVFKENISYGFRRNCLGLKPFAIAVSVLAAGYTGIQFMGISPTTLLQTSLPQIAVGCISALFALWWTFGVTANWVRDAGDAYAKALLGACDIV